MDKKISMTVSVDVDIEFGFSVALEYLKKDIKSLRNLGTKKVCF